MKRSLLALLMALQTASAALVIVATDSGSLPAGCEAETGLSGRSDVLMCEPWETSSWWQDGYVENQEKTDPSAAIGPDSSEVISTDCISGSCLQVNCKAWDNGGGCGGALSLVKDIPGQPEEVYLRYYLKLATNWTPTNICGSAQPSLCGGTAGVEVSDGGKWIGLADGRTNADPSGQCGNGGDQGDGINCWTMRADYRDCFSGDGEACSTKPAATTRYGGYLYFYDQQTATGSHALWDTDDWHQTGFNCGAANDVLCGIGDGGVLVNDQWYLIEMYVKMNTPDVEDGIIRGWVDGVLSYEKTNMLFRLTGHDDLHVRTVWLNVHAGGEGVGPPDDTEVFFDQLVVATDAQIGALP